MTQPPTCIPLRVVIVDDEPLAREKLRSLLHRHPEIEIVAECEDGRACVDTIAELAPDLVFLDVQMPERDGFEALTAASEQIGSSRLPAIVFVTAYDDYAIRAFEAGAMEYL